jgi:signal peptidase II
VRKFSIFASGFSIAVNMPQDLPSAANVPRRTESKIENSKSKIQRLLAYRLLLILAVVVFALDQITKEWIAARFPQMGHDVDHLSGELSITVVPHFFYLIHVGNPGAAWSMLSGYGWLLAVLAAVTLVAIFFWRHSLGLRHRSVQICFGLLCGGIVGNLVDRLRHGHVIDFIDLHFGSYVYPTFNVADSGICVGVILYLWQSLRAPKSQ